MKILSFAILLVIASVAPLPAQTVPAAPASRPAVAAPGSLSKDERARAISYLKETQKELAAATDGLSEAQWKFKAAPDKWSIAETAEHIAVAEDKIWQLVSGKMMKSPATPERRAEVQGQEEMIMKTIPDRSRKAQAPEELRPTGKWTTRPDLMKAFNTIREQEITYLTETQEDLRSHFEDHPAPFLKTMDAWQWLIFNGPHGKRHTAQILEVKADPNFPKS